MKKLLAISLSILMAMGFTACDRTREEATQPSPSTAAVQTITNPRTPKNPYVDEVKIAYVAHDIGTPVNQAWLEGLEREVAYYPNIKIQGFDGKSSAENQIKIMDELITQEYDAIVIQASDNAALAPSVTKAEQAGIPVIGLNLDVDSPHAAHVQMVDYDAGRLVAEEMVKATGGTGSVVIIQGLPGIPRPTNIEKGFRETIAKHPDMKIIGSQAADFEKEKAISVMNSFMQSNDKIDCVFAINDAMAEGAAIAADSAGRLEGMNIWGADGEKEALKMIEEGKLTGTIYTNCWTQGETAARVACMLIGSEYDSSKLTKTPVINMQPVVVTKDSVGTIIERDRW